MRKKSVNVFGNKAKTNWNIIVWAVFGFFAVMFIYFFFFAWSGGLFNLFKGIEKEIEGEIGELSSLIGPLAEPNSLVAHWSFEDNYNDFVGGHDGIPIGDPQFKAGKVDKSIKFDGTDDYLEVPDHEDIDFEADENFSISFWIKVPVHDDTPWKLSRFLFKSHMNSPRIGYYFAVEWRYQIGVGKLIFYALDSDTYSGYVISNISINDNAWHHIIGVKQGSNGYLYIDGKLDNNVNNMPTGNLSTNQSLKLASIGHNWSSMAGDMMFNGSLDEVKIWNYALDENKVYEEYMEGGRGLVGHYDFDYTAESDNFDYYDENKWYELPSDWSISNGKLNVEAVSSGYVVTKTLLNKEILSGDFEIEIDFSDFKGEINFDRIVFMVGREDWDNGYHAYLFRNYYDASPAKGKVNAAIKFPDSLGGYSAKNIDYAEDYGKFKIIRNNSDISLYYFDNSWKLLYSNNSFTTENLNVSVSVIAMNETGNVNGKFDNFLVEPAEATKDKSESGNDGVIINYPQFVEDLNGHGQALEFEGVDSYIEIPDSYSLDFNSLNNFTVLAWVNLKDNITQSIASKGDFNDPVNAQGFNVHYNGETNVIRSFITSSVLGSPKLCIVDSSTDLAKQGWNHVAVVFKRADSCTVDNFDIYINGISETLNISLNNINTSTDISTTEPLLIGSRKILGVIQNHLNGSLDEVRIFNYALNDEEIYSQYLDHFCEDFDNDGYSITGGDCGILDCDDFNAYINQGVNEDCGTGYDDNCDGSVNEGCDSGDDDSGGSSGPSGPGIPWTPPTNTSNITCTENWTCEDWSECKNSQQTRACSDDNYCNTTINMPITIQVCDSGNETPQNQTADPDNGGGFSFIGLINFIKKYLFVFILIVGIIITILTIILVLIIKSRKKTPISPALHDKSIQLVNWAKSKGMNDEQIKESFIKRGWKESDIRKIMDESSKKSYPPEK